MKSITAVDKRIYLPAVFLSPVLLMGCSTPPSVAPLLRVTERALVAESGRLQEDAERDKTYTRQVLGSLDDAYRRDLEQAETLTPGWVLEATTVYVAARDAVIRHEQSLTRERDNRADNLRAAATATRRAILLIEQQDGLLRGLAGEELSQLLDGLSNTD
jgi:hypothetical protein